MKCSCLCCLSLSVTAHFPVKEDLLHGDLSLCLSLDLSFCLTLLRKSALTFSQNRRPAGQMRSVVQGGKGRGGVISNPTFFPTLIAADKPEP